MRIGVVSDIHCNLDNFVCALEEMGQVDAILCAGDAVYQYRFSNPIYDIIRKRGIHSVIGNHESIILSWQGQRLRSSGAIHPENLAFLERLPTTLRLDLDGKRILMTHGSPWEPTYDYLLAGDRRLKRLAELGVDIVVLGHTHYPLVLREGPVLIVNPGSLEEPRDPRYGMKPTYAIVDTETESVEIRACGAPSQTSGSVADIPGPGAD